jgi:hypothetical protein
MKILTGCLALVGFGSLMFLACGSDDSGPTPANTAGAAGSTAGAAGASGQTGTGGAAGKGGSPGTGGAGGSPAGGSSGAAGAAGAMNADAKVIYLHHSTGGVIWGGGVQDWVTNYATTNSKTYAITDQEFPKSDPYGWKNYPFDYWNIWVNHGGDQEYMTEPTLEILTKTYDVIVFKHCFPVSGIEADGTPDVTDETKTVANYKLQYAALKDKMHTFPGNRFLVWTGAALKESENSPESAQRAKDFFEWVRTTWDEKGDNIFVWDFWTLETEGGLYLTDANASGDSHPNDAFAKKVAPYFGQRLVDVIEGRGDTGSITGQ